MTAFTLGADPEFLLTNGQKFISAVGKMLGSKNEPKKMSFGAVQVDNVACEFNTIPAKTAEEFCSSVREPLDYLDNLFEAQNLLISDECLGEFEESELSPETKESGCDPDFNAWREGEINIPPCLHNTNLRSAAGHVHVGLEIDDYEAICLVKALDLFVSVPSLYLENPSRRDLYGKAGCYRRKEYGIEYRTPSNFWTFYSSRRRWMWNSVKEAVTHFRTIGLPHDLERVVNEHDLVRAEELIKEFRLVKCPQF